MDSMTWITLAVVTAIVLAAAAPALRPRRGVLDPTAATVAAAIPPEPAAPATTIPAPPRLVPGMVERPTGPLDHDGYQQLLDYVATSATDETMAEFDAAEALVGAAPDDTGSLLRMVVHHSRIGLEAMRAAQPPPDVAVQHARVVAAMSGFVDAMQRASTDPAILAGGESAFEATVTGNPAVTELTAAMAGVAAAGYRVD